MFEAALQAVSLNPDYYQKLQDLIKSNSNGSYTVTFQAPKATRSPSRKYDLDRYQGGSLTKHGQVVDGIRDDGDGEISMSLATFEKYFDYIECLPLLVRTLSVNAQDGAVVNGRSMEWGEDLHSRLVLHPVHEAVASDAPAARRGLAGPQNTATSALTPMV
ncbi:unnamed protein product [Sphagnum balticum]